MIYPLDRVDMYVELGHQNEKGVSEIEFDVTDWLTDYPTGVISITYIRPTETAVCPVSGAVSLATPTSGDLALTFVEDVNILTWTVSDTVTEIVGTGSVVVSLAVGSTVVKKSELVKTIVDAGHASAGAAPTAVADWIADATAKLNEMDGRDLNGVEFVGDDMVFSKINADTVTLAGAKTALKGDQGIQGVQGVQGLKGDKGDVGNVLYATFSQDSGDIIMTTPDGYTGPTFAINDNNLEVTI